MVQIESLYFCCISSSFTFREKRTACKRCESECLSFGSRNNRVHLQELTLHVFCLTDFLPKPDIYCVLFLEHQVCTQ